jgi:hypothetical protein
MTFAPRLLAIGLALLFAVSSAAVLGQDAPDKAAPESTKESGKSRIKIFKLKHRNLNEITLFVGLMSPKGPKNPSGRLAFDEKTNSIFLRGEGDWVDRFEKVVAAIDVPAEEITSTSLPGLVILPMTGDANRQEEVVEILHTLGIEPRSIQLDKTRLFVLRADDDENADIEKVLEVLAPGSAERAAAE